MNVVDLIILIVIVIGGLIGGKRGFTRQLISFVGIFAILIFSFLLKNPVSVFLYNNLPFFNFGGMFKGITVLNILLYEVIAFFIVFSLLSIIFQLLLIISKIFEKILKMTIILGIPSTILGSILGMLQAVVFVFIAMYILSLPTLNFVEVKNSKVGNFILDNTPILNKVCDDTVLIFNDIVDLKNEYQESDNTDQFNQDALDKMIERKIITKENAQKLIDKGKLKGVVVK